VLVVVLLVSGRGNWHETENWCSVRNLNKEVKERRERKARNKNTNKQQKEIMAERLRMGKNTLMGMFYTF